MAFINLILKNIWRMRARTILTVLGISLGIATIVTLGVIGEGLKDTLEKTIKTGDADFTVAQANVADFTFSLVTKEQIKKIRKTKGVDEVVGVLWGFTKIETNPFFILYGIDEKDIDLMGANLEKGRVFRDGKYEIVLGKIAANNIKKNVGDNLAVRNKNYKIVGVFETGNPMQDGGGLVPLDILQDQEKKKGRVTMALVKVDNNVRDIKKFTKKIENEFDGDLEALADVSEFSSVDQGLVIMDFLSGAISFLAVIIGGIGVMNTIMMSVFERTREIGVLRAIGWKKRRILTMILGESFFLGLVSIVVGTSIGLLVIEYLMTYPVAASFFSPDYSLITFERAIAVGLLVSVLGGLYPAFRATRFSPAEALRYE